jgi:hypothetical protein
MPDLQDIGNQIFIPNRLVWTVRYRYKRYSSCNKIAFQSYNKTGKVNMSKIANRTNWLDYLRSFITILVVAHHSSLAYTTFAHFNKKVYILSTHPIVDTIRWKGLDIFEDFNDIFFMSLISGIFIV